MSFLPLVRLWLWISALASVAGWILSALGQLNRPGYAAFFAVFAFADQPLLPSKVFLVAQPVTTAALAVLLLWTGKTSWSVSLAGHLAAFFVAERLCEIVDLYHLMVFPQLSPW